MLCCRQFQLRHAIRHEPRKTEVDEFGGGIVPVLNERMGLTTVAPECSQLGLA